MKERERKRERDRDRERERERERETYVLKHSTRCEKPETLERHMF